VLALLNDLEGAAARGEAAHERVRERYLGTHALLDFLALFERLLSRDQHGFEQLRQLQPAGERLRAAGGRPQDAADGLGGIFSRARCAATWSPLGLHIYAMSIANQSRAMETMASDERARRSHPCRAAGLLIDLAGRLLGDRKADATS
jgi:hypothetical protein